MPLTMLWARPPVRWVTDALSSRPPLRAGLRVGAIYAVVAALWIALSDRLLASWIGDPDRLTAFQTYKGWGFVAASGILIAWLTVREMRRTRESETLFRSIVEQTLVGVYVVRRGRFVYLNPRLAEIFGYGQDEMTDRVGVADVVAPADRDVVLENLRRREEGRVDALRYEFRGLRSDGAELQLEVFGRRVELGGEPAVVGILLDRSEQKALEDQLQRSQRMEAIGQLTGAVAHDFNNLLTAIIAPLEMCLSELDRSDELRSELIEVRNTAERAASLTGKLLAFSRRQLHRPRVLDPGRALAEVEPMLRRLLPASVELRVDADELEHNVRIDPSALEQIVVNLAVNARDAMPEGGRLTIRTYEVAPSADDPEMSEVGRAGPHACLEVSDTGVGMSEATQERIFDPFFTTKDEGTGLGLATVFGHAQKAGGRVTVDSRPGEGSTFRVYLPGVTDEAEADEGPGDPVRAPSERARILVVEDDERVRTVTVAALRRFGYEFRAAESVEAALEVGRTPEGDVHLLVTDVMLGDGTCPGLAEEYVARRPGTRVVFMSGYSDDEVLERARALEGMTFLEKPFTLDELTRTVERALAGPPLTVKGRSA